MPAALIVDDNFHNRHVFRMTLERVGYKVTEAEDGAKGLNELKNGAFGLLILDLRMPVMNGSDMLRILRKTDAWQNLLVVVVTANPHMVTDEVRAMADYVLQKPVDLPSFSALMQRLYVKLSPSQVGG